MNPESGEVCEAQFFVAALGASNLTYAEATWAQNLSDWNPQAQQEGSSVLSSGTNRCYCKLRSYLQSAKAVAEITQLISDQALSHEVSREYIATGEEIVFDPGNVVHSL